MKINPSLKYQFSENIKQLIIYYPIFFSILTIMISLSMVSTANTTFSGTELGSIVFIFVLGLNMLKSSFHFGLANSVSRKTIFSSFIFSIIPIASIMALVDIMTLFIFNGLLKIQYRSFFFQIYHNKYQSGSINSITLGLDFIGESLLWSIFIYTMICIIGLFITTLYYQMNKIARVIVSCGVPLTLFVVLPIIDSNITNGKIFPFLFNFIKSSMGFGSSNVGNPYISILTFTIISILLTGITYLMMRRATIKET